MRLGVVGRSDLRGLGHQTLAVADALGPERVLLVEPQPASWPQHRNRWSAHKSTHVYWKRGRLHPERDVRRWLKGLDAVYTAESPYDPRLPFWAADAGCTLVRHANPEQLGDDEVVDGDPTVWWAPTPWRLEHLPAGTRVVPMPVESAPQVSSNLRELTRFVHTVGHAAQEDRAGSRIVSQAVKLLRVPCEVVVWCQDRRLDVPFRSHGDVKVEVRTGGVADRWEQYRGGDALILPRRYGGLSLPSQEAMAAGLALVMTDTSPNEVWPGPRVSVRQRRSVRMRCGPVDTYDASVWSLVETMTGLVEDRGLLAKYQTESLAWADRNSWEALRPLWLEEFRRACSSPGGEAAPTGSAPTPGSVNA